MTRLAARLGLELPLLQAGMGAIAGPALCAAVSRAGAGGTLALFKEPPARAARRVRQVAAATCRTRRAARAGGSLNSARVPPAPARDTAAHSAGPAMAPIPA